MKPRIFIGSSVEKLAIANAIQENLEHDAVITLWNQGIFNLSSNTLDDLLKALNNFDFAIFIFEPEDITKIRDGHFQTVRDNVVFELGLFIGRLGKERVFYLVPKNTTNFRLPTDLLGLTSGAFDNHREDGNLNASVGSFCNQVRKQVKSFVLENLEGFQTETKEARRLAYEKPDYWEYLLAAELLRSKMIKINRSYSELEKGLYIQRRKPVDDDEFFDFSSKTLSIYQGLTELFRKCLSELQDSFGPSGVAGKPIEIKEAVDRWIRLSHEMLAWEYELDSLDPSDDFIEIKQNMRGWSKIFIDKMNDIHISLNEFVISILNGTNKSTEINHVIVLEAPSNMHSTFELLNDRILLKKRGY